MKSLLGVGTFARPEWMKCEDSEMAVMMVIGTVRFFISVAGF